MFLLSAQNNFCIILSSFVEGYVKKNSSLNFMSLVGFQASKSGSFFGKCYVELVWKSFSGRNRFLFSNSLLYDLEESRELRALIRWLLV